jgi:hypothetical protein
MAAGPEVRCLPCGGRCVPEQALGDSLGPRLVAGPSGNVLLCKVWSRRPLTSNLRSKIGAAWETLSGAK